MASTNTTHKAYKKPATGDIGWGPDVNGNFDALDGDVYDLETAVTGLQNSLAGIEASIGELPSGTDISNEVTRAKQQEVRNLVLALRAAYRAGGRPDHKPDASNTGPRRTGLTTVSGTFTSSANGQIIVGQRFTGNVNIVHSDVVMIDCQSDHRVRIYDVAGSANNNVPARNLVTLFCDIGPATGGQPEEAGLQYQYYTAIACNIHGFRDGFKVGNDTFVYGCYIHDHYKDNDPAQGGSLAHCDGFQVVGDANAGYCRNFEVIGNNFYGRAYLVNGTESGMNAAAIVKTDNSNIEDGLIKGNWFYAKNANSVIYNTNNLTNFDPPSNITWEDNVFYPSYTSSTFIDLPPTGFQRTGFRNNRIGDINTFAIGEYHDALAGVKGNGIRLLGKDNATSKISTPYVAGRTPVASLFVEADIAPESWSTGASQGIAAQADGADNTRASWRFWISSGGALTFRWHYSTTLGPIQVSCSRSFSASMGRRRVAVWYEAVSSTVYNLHFYVGPTNRAITAADKIETITATVSAGQTTIVDANIDYTAGCRFSGTNTADRLVGDVYYVGIRQGGPGGTLVAELNPLDTLVADSASPTSIVGSTNEVWTFSAGAFWAAAKPGCTDLAWLPRMSDSYDVMTAGHMQSVVDAASQASARPPAQHSASTKLLPWETRVFATGGASGITETLPYPKDGLEIVITKADSGAGAVTVATLAGTINGSSTYNLTSQYQSATFTASNGNWYRR